MDLYSEQSPNSAEILYTILLIKHLFYIVSKAVSLPYSCTDTCPPTEIKTSRNSRTWAWLMGFQMASTFHSGIKRIGNRNNIVRSLSQKIQKKELYVFFTSGLSSISNVSLVDRWEKSHRNQEPSPVCTWCKSLSRHCRNLWIFAWKERLRWPGRTTQRVFTRKTAVHIYIFCSFLFCFFEVQTISTKTYKYLTRRTETERWQKWNRVLDLKDELQESSNGS